MNKADRETFAQCQGACQVCLLAGGCDLEKKLARRKGATCQTFIIGALVLGLTLTTGPAWAGKGKLEARRTSSGEIVYTRTGGTTAKASRATTTTPKAQPGPIYDASGALRGMRYDMGPGAKYSRNCTRSIMGTGAEAVSVEVCRP